MVGVCDTPYSSTLGQGGQAKLLRRSDFPFCNDAISYHGGLHSPKDTSLYLDSLLAEISLHHCLGCSTSHLDQYVERRSYIIMNLVLDGNNNRMSSIIRTQCL